MLVKGKPRTRGIPEGPATSAAAAEQVADEATAAELGSLGGKAAGFSTEEAAAEMFRAKPSQAVRAHSCSCRGPGTVFCALKAVLAQENRL